MEGLMLKIHCDSGLTVADRLAFLVGLRFYSANSVSENASDGNGGVCYYVRDCSRTDESKPCIIVRKLGDGEYLIEHDGRLNDFGNIKGLAERLREIL